MNFRGDDWRSRRNLLNQGVAFTPIHYSLANYSTDTNAERKSGMKQTSVEEELFTRLHAIPDPLKKNLADTLIIGEDTKDRKVKMSSVEEFYYENTVNSDMKPQEQGNSRDTDSYPSLAGITGFITSFFGAISGAMFHKRPKSPVSQYYDCFDSNTDNSHEGSPSMSWQMPNCEDQNKNGRAHVQFCTAPPNDSMNNCRTAVAHCEGKLNAVRSLLTNKTAPSTAKFRPRRPRRVFVEPGAVEESYEDAFTPEDYVSIATDDYVEYINIPKSFQEEFCEVDTAKLRTGFGTAQESTDIVKDVDTVKEINDNASQIQNMESDKTIVKENLENRTETNNNSIVNNNKRNDNNTNIPKEISAPNTGNTNNTEVASTNKEVISSCEDKMAKLKSLLQEKRTKSNKTHQNSTDSVAEFEEKIEVFEPFKRPTKTLAIEKKHDRRFKNPNRLHTDKRRKTRMRKNIQDDMKFAHEIDSEDIASSTENSPRILVTKAQSEPILESENKEYFDEVKGRFHTSSTTESEDSFQIVFSDSSVMSRLQRPSDCESEDSFIVFEDSPDSCYTSNEVFGESDQSDEEYTDSDSDVSDSGCVSEICKLSHNFSRTVGDLTDQSLYEDVKESKDDVQDSTDDVDCAIRTVGEVLPSDSVGDVVAEDAETAAVEEKKTGLLIDDVKKLQRKGQPVKKVRFSEQPPKVHVMRVWAFAARQARAGHWERHALDRERFKRRIADVEVAVSWVLKPQHRSRVMFQRFMPWWNQQRRKEIAEKKQREEEERIQRELEEERRKIEEEERLKKEEEDRLKREEEAKLKAEADRIEAEKKRERDRQKNCKVTKYVFKNGQYSKVCPQKQQIDNEIDERDIVAQNNNDSDSEKVTDVDLIEVNNKVDNITGVV